MNIIDVQDTIPKSNYRNIITNPLGVTLHITADSKRGKAVSWFQNRQSGVSANAVIEKNGDLMLCVAFNKQAYHNGVVVGPTAKIIVDNLPKNPNSYMIGIEIVSSGEAPTDAQMQTLKEILIDLSSMYNFPLDRYHVIGHYEVCPVRRPIDPIISFSINEVLNSIENDKRINKLQTERDRYKQEIETLKLLSLENKNKSEKEIRRLEAIIKKSRNYGSKMREYYQNVLRKLKG